MCLFFSTCRTTEGGAALHGWFVPKGSCDPLRDRLYKEAREAGVCPLGARSGPYDPERPSRWTSAAPGAARAGGRHNRRHKWKGSQTRRPVSNNPTSATQFADPSRRRRQPAKQPQQQVHAESGSTSYMHGMSHNTQGSRLVHQESGIRGEPW
jgi:hypothetical protein